MKEIMSHAGSNKIKYVQHHAQGQFHDLCSRYAPFPSNSPVTFNSFSVGV